jgi:hypothetical protein
MRTLPLAAAIAFALSGFVPLQADKSDDGFRPMFNGKDLTGWVNVNCAPSTFFVRDGEIITTGKPTGYLRTEKQYENFIAEFDWMHVNKTEVGNSGFFVWADPLPAVGTPYTRGIEVQVLVNLEKEGYYTSQGDLFSIWGAHCKPDRPHPHGWERCLPSENRTKGGGEWNHYKVVGNNGVLKLHVNGKEVSGISQCTPRKGYLALESEGAECHFKNLKIKELPSTNPKPEEVADVAQGFHQLYTGLDLSGWQGDKDAIKHWKPRDWVLHYDGKGGALRTAREYGDAEFIFDFRFLKKGSKPCKFALRAGMTDGVEVSLALDGLLSVGTQQRRWTGASDKPTVGKWLRADCTTSVNTISIVTYYSPKEILGSGRGPIPRGPSKTGRLVLHPEGEMEFGNLFVRELKK